MKKQPTTPDKPRFPFGQPLKQVRQKDKSPKHTFVLGVYASAVHAKWLDAKGKTLVRALAVASEPGIFWKGGEEEAKKIVNRIKLPEGVGTLEPAAPAYNGPSGEALDSRILIPLGLTREDVWLCDCIPASRVNPAQKKAIEDHYDSLVKKGLVEPATIPEVETTIDDKRRAEILKELEASGAERIILLGDLPIKWFLKHFADGWSNLSAFEKKHGYGKSVSVTINDRKYEVLPLAHPRQVARLGRSSTKWFDLHEKWMKKMVRRRGK
jgi:uracil-DNA glycosylase